MAAVTIRCLYILPPAVSVICARGYGGRWHWSRNYTQKNVAFLRGTRIERRDVLANHLLESARSSVDGAVRRAELWDGIQSTRRGCNSVVVSGCDGGSTSKDNKLKSQSVTQRPIRGARKETAERQSTSALSSSCLSLYCKGIDEAASLAED